MAPLSLVIFLVAIFGIQPISIDYANEVATNPVGDIILSNIPVFNVGWFFVYGMFLLVAFITALCLYHPKRIAFTLHSLTLFVLIRSLFVSLTHVGSFTTEAVSHFGPGITEMFFGADHFFSGHAGAPFLMALMYWHKPRLRYIFLVWSAFFAVIVLLGHLHYSIDVLAAYFITYGIYHIALWLFPRERERFLLES
jgi:membrane-associated phospholipid phosphatase